MRTMERRVHEVLSPVDTERRPRAKTLRMPFMRSTRSPCRLSRMVSQMPKAMQSNGLSKTRLKLVMSAACRPCDSGHRGHKVVKCLAAEHLHERRMRVAILGSHPQRPWFIRRSSWLLYYDTANVDKA